MFLNAVRHQKVVMSYAKEAPYLDKTNLNPEYLMEEDEFKNKLMAVIQDLNEEQRVVFLLNRIDDKKYREIAEMLEISQKTVEKRNGLKVKYLLRKSKNDIPVKIFQPLKNLVFIQNKLTFQ